MSLIHSTLNRNVSLLSLVAYYFATIVGVGIFIVPIFAAKIAGPASIISWLITLLMAYPFAMIFAQISQRYQVSGSVQKFLQDAYGNQLGRAYALFMVVTALFGNTLLGVAAAGYALDIIKAFTSFDNLANSSGTSSLESLTYPIVLFVLMLSCLFNLINIGTSSKIQTLLLLFVMIFIELVVLFSIPHYRLDNIVPFKPNGTDSIISAVLICFYSVVGWDNVDAIAGEVKEPIKSYKKAIKIALALISFFYLSFAFTVVFALDSQEINSGSTIITILLTKALGSTYSLIGSFASLLIIILGANVWVLGTSRMIYALALDGLLPKRLTILGKKSRIPYFAVLVQLIFYSTIILTFMASNLEQNIIIEIASINYLLLYSLVFIGGIRIFTTKRLKALAFTAAIIAIGFILQGSKITIIYSSVIAFVCVLFVQFIKPINRRHELAI